MAEVILKNIVKAYGSVYAVNDVSFTVGDGEFVALVGPSGCGKTTTLNLVAGLLELTGGEIFIGERKVNDLDPKDRDIAMVFQNYALYPNKTVFENLAFPLRMRKVNKLEIDKRVKHAAELLSITPLLQRRPRELSGGQQQRVALGRALVRQPRVFLMDEPLSNLDAKLRVQMRAELKRFHQDLKATIMYVTHDQLEAVTMADKMAVMDGGLLQQYASPDHVYHHPANTFVAGFVGSPAMNQLKAQVSSDGDRVVLASEDGWSLSISGRNSVRARAAQSGTVVLGVRHSAIALHRNETPNAIPATVYTVEPTGDLTFVHARVGGTMLVVSVPPATVIAPDDHVWLEPDHERMHLFDASNGLTLEQAAP